MYFADDVHHKVGYIFFVMWLMDDAVLSKPLSTNIMCVGVYVCVYVYNF